MNTSKQPFFSVRRKKTEDGAGAPDGIFLPAGRRLGTCMTHRQDIVWIDSGMKKDEILGVISGHPEYSMFPVCAGTVDSVVGVLPVRLFLHSLLQGPWQGLKPLVRKPVYLPESVTILRTLTLLDEADCRMGFVIDEYGGIEGLVTRNGLVGELLSEVATGAGDEGEDIFRREDGSYLVGGQVRMDEIADLFPLPDAESGSHEYYTLAGYLLALNGSIPKTGDRIRSGRYLCEIIDMDGHRIDKVLISDLSGDKGLNGS